MPPASEMGSVTTIHQRFYKASLPPITLEHVDLASLTAKSVADLISTMPGKRLGVAASYGKKCVLDSLAFSTESRVLLIMMNRNSGLAKRQLKILREGLLGNTFVEKHGFFMEHLAAALHLDYGLYIRNAFDITSPGNTRGSMAAYKGVLKLARPGHRLDGSVVKFIFAQQAFILSRKTEFALRAWACYVAVQQTPDLPGVIDTSAKGSQARSTYQSCMAIT
jgi:hypothetical protein